MVEKITLENTRSKITKAQFLKDLGTDIRRCRQAKNNTRLADTVYVKFPKTDYWEEWRYDFYFDNTTKTIKGKIFLYEHEPTKPTKIIAYDYNADKFGWVDWTPTYGNRADITILEFFKREVGKFVE